MTSFIQITNWDPQAFRTSPMSTILFWTATLEGRGDTILFKWSRDNSTYSKSVSSSGGHSLYLHEKWKKKTEEQTPPRLLSYLLTADQSKRVLDVGFVKLQKCSDNLIRRSKKVWGPLTIQQEAQTGALRVHSSEFSQLCFEVTAKHQQANPKCYHNSSGGDHEYLNQSPWAPIVDEILQDWAKSMDRLSDIAISTKLHR